MSLSLKVYHCPRGMEQDLVRLLMNNRFSLTKYAVNNTDPFDTVIDFADPATGLKMVEFIKTQVPRLRGQHVALDAQLQVPPNVNIRPQQQMAPTNRPNTSTGSFNNGPRANTGQSWSRNEPRANTLSNNGPASAIPHRSNNGSASAIPHRSNNEPSQSNAPRRPDKVKDIRRNVRSLLATEKKGLDAMRFMNNYQELTGESIFDDIRKINYQTLTDFCNDNLDCIDYEAWNNGAIAIFHGVPDAKTAHIFQMNQATRSKNAPNARPIPMRFQAKFGNFFKPKHKVLEMQNKLNNEPLELPDKHKRRIVTVIKSCPEGLSTDEVKLKYSELYEEPFPMQHLCDITKKRYLVDILALIQQLRHLNGRWMVLNETPPDNRPAPPAPPIVPKDISKSAEFQTLKTNVITALRNTTDYTMTLSSLQTAANIDVMLFGRSSAAELLDLIDEIKIRQSDNNSWIIHLKHKGQELSYRVLLSIYSTLNSDPNGLLLGEFDNVYQRLNGRKLIAADYGYKSLWHIFFNYSEMVSMTHTNAGLLLIAEIAPEAPAAPPGFSEPRNGPLMSGAAAQHYISPVQNRASSSTGQTTSYQKKETSLKGQAAVDRPVLTGKEEISLGFRDFQADGEFVIIYIKEIYSPNEFYVWFYKDSPEATEEYKQFFQKLNQFYNVRMNRVKHSLSPPYKKDQLCVYRDEHDRYHRAVVDKESTINADIVAVRAVDTAEKSQVAPACLFRINDQFRLVKSFTRRCGLCDIRPFNSKTWDDKSRDVFGPKHTDKLYYAKIMFESDQEVELNVIDTHDDEDRHFSDVLVAVGSAENISPTNGVINNAPSTPNDSFTVDDDDEDDDDDWLNDWLADEDTPTIDNSHINISSLHVANPVPTPQVTNPPQTSNLWDAPLLPNHGGANNSSSEFLKNLMQVNRKR